MIDMTTLLAADPALPQRDTLLEPVGIANRIQRRLGMSVELKGCERLRVNYQIGKSMRVLHRLVLADTSVVVAARAFRAGRSAAAFAEASACARSIGRWPAVVHDADLETVFWTFPNDRKIVDLPAIASPSSDVTGILPGWKSSHLVAYAPEKSATMQCVDESGEILAYAKVTSQHQAGRDFAEYVALQRALDRDSAYLRLPRPLAYCEPRRLLLIEAVAGRRAADPGSSQSDVQADFNSLGAALATFHGLTPHAAPRFARFDSDRLVEAQQALSRIRPDIARLIDEIVNALQRTRPSNDDPPVCLHGDVHPKNVIVSEDRVTLLDVEDLAIGPAAADLGSVLAGLAYLRRARQLSDRAAGDLAETFFAGYSKARPLPGRSSIRWHSAAALLVERVLRAVTRIRPLGLQHLDALLTDVGAMLTGTHDVETAVLR